MLLIQRSSMNFLEQINWTLPRHRDGRTNERTDGRTNELTNRVIPMRGAQKMAESSRVAVDVVVAVAVAVVASRR